MHTTVLRNRFSSHTGFTLLELIITLAIVCLLITISYPVYTQYVMKTHRAQAEVALLDLASSAERYHVLYNTYAGMTLTDLEVNQYTENNFYQLEINSATENNYLLKAIPLNAQTKDKCGTLSLNDAGEKGVSGINKVTDCW